MGYDIDPAGVARVLKSLIGPSKELQTAGKKCADGMAGAARNCQSGLIVAALNDFADYHDKPLKDIAWRVEACPRGAYEAIKAYLAGDHEMEWRAATFEQRHEVQQSAQQAQEQRQHMLR